MARDSDGESSILTSDACSCSETELAARDSRFPDSSYASSELELASTDPSVMSSVLRFFFLSFLDFLLGYSLEIILVVSGLGCT